MLGFLLVGMTIQPYRDILFYTPFSAFIICWPIIFFFYAKLVKIHRSNFQKKACISILFLVLLTLLCVAIWLWVYFGVIVLSDGMDKILRQLVSKKLVLISMIILFYSEYPILYYYYKKLMFQVVSCWFYFIQMDKTYLIAFFGDASFYRLFWYYRLLFRNEILSRLVVLSFLFNLVYCIAITDIQSNDSTIRLKCLFFDQNRSFIGFK
jgi:hypothetical protein